MEGIKLSSFLVTGGAGFIGSNLCRHLLGRGHDVICMDNLFTGKMSNIEELLDSDHFQFINHDVTESYDLDVDYIFNLACPASPPKYQIDPIKTIKTSVYGIINALDLAVRTGATVLQSSTSEVYGNPLVHPQTEDYWGNVNPVGMRSCYDEGKRIAETLLIEYHRKYGTRIKIARIFNTYGPYMDPQDGRVVSNVIIQALNRAPITIYGNGTQTRSFCYISDMVDGLMKLMNSNDEVLGPINIGNPGEFTINELVELVKEKTGSDSPVEYLPLPLDDPLKRRPDITKAKEQLDWEPTVQLSEGLDRTIDYFSSINDTMMN